MIELFAALEASWLGVLVRDSTWLFPVLETLHFAGMALLIGVIVIIDLRVLGFARGLPVGPLHRFLPLGLFGFGLNVATGLAMLASDPMSYWEVSPFRFKMLLILLAGINAVWFWVAMLPDAKQWGTGAQASRVAKLSSLASLVFWTGVIGSARFIAFWGTGPL
jgi:hypothetical protein